MRARSSLVNLKKLCLEVRSVSNKDLNALRPHLATLTNLKDLSLQGSSKPNSEDCQADSEAIQAFAPTLASLTKLSSLTFWHLSLGAKGAQALAPHLACLTNLSTLLLSSNDFGDEGARALAPHLACLTNQSTCI
jgi:hypothetical protein